MKTSVYMNAVHLEETNELYINNESADSLIWSLTVVNEIRMKWVLLTESILHCT